MASSTSSPCAACKFLRRKCTPGCVFAPYFPPDQPQRFAHVHRVFGASNVAKLLNELTPAQREDAVSSLAYEAEARLRDPVYGCVGYISLLQHKLQQLQQDLYNAKKELSAYMGPAALGPFLTPQPLPGPHFPGAFGVPMAGTGLGLGIHYQHQQQQQQQQQFTVEAQHLALVMAAAAAREQQMIRNHERSQQSDFRSVSMAVAAALDPVQQLEIPVYMEQVQHQQQEQQREEQFGPEAQHFKREIDEGGNQGIGPSS